jgi:hypothetical protein
MSEASDPRRLNVLEQVKMPGAAIRNLHALGPIALLLFFLAPIANSQLQIRSQEHSCEGGNQWHAPACESAWRPEISVVFLGLATDVREEEVPVILDGEKTHTLRLHVTFQVEEAFRGVSEKVVTVVSGGDLCGMPFSKGEKDVVYGRRLSNGEVYVSISSPTKSAKDAGEDLNYLRGLPAAAQGATIYGTVFRYTTPEIPGRMVIRRGIPETGHKVEVQGISQSYEAITDSRGNFRLSGLSPGQYTVSLSADGEVHTSPLLRSTTVEVADKGCARFSFSIDPFAKNDQKNPAEK